MSLVMDVQKLSPGAILVFFIIDATVLGGDITYCHSGTNELGVPVVWQGITYRPLPIMVKGYDKSGTGRLPKPVLTVANVAGLVGQLVSEFDDLIGAKITRKRTFAQYLDAVNFAAGNPSADPDELFEPDIFYVEQKTNENKNMVELTLSSPNDVNGVQIPLRIVVQSCTNDYRGEGCNYAGGAVADEFDQPTSNLALDKCSFELTGCVLRFPAPAILPFGGFPAAGLFS